MQHEKGGRVFIPSHTTPNRCGPIQQRVCPATKAAQQHLLAHFFILAPTKITTMHKTIITAACMLLMALQTQAQTITPKRSDATVNQMQGIYVFAQCKPVSEYTYLGSTKIKVVWTGQPEEMLNITLKKIKKDYAQADGVIFTTLQMDQADVIKFK